LPRGVPEDRIGLEVRSAYIHFVAPDSRCQAYESAWENAILHYLEGLWRFGFGFGTMYSMEMITSLLRYVIDSDIIPTLTATRQPDNAIIYKAVTNWTPEGGSSGDQRLTEPPPRIIEKRQRGRL
jgi:hypothetical protein